MLRAGGLIWGTSEIQKDTGLHLEIQRHMGRLGNQCVPLWYPSVISHSAVMTHSYLWFPVGETRTLESQEGLEKQVQ